jgi:hypothetical protein
MIKKGTVIFIHALIGWILCAATMSIGMKYLLIANALVIHAIAAPIIFLFISLNYYRRFNYTSPLITSVIFTIFVILIDFFIVAILITKSMDMFKSFIGTWLPFILIFSSTLITGIVNKNKA